jgi:hypothetical protein
MSSIKCDLSADLPLGDRALVVTAVFSFNEQNYIPYSGINEGLWSCFIVENDPYLFYMLFI